MSTTASPIEKMIIDNVKKLTQTKTFVEWFSAQQIANEDWVLINNSFIYRKPFIKTSKSNQFIGLKVKNCSDPIKLDTKGALCYQV